MSPDRPVTPPVSGPGRGRRRRYVAPPHNLGPSADALFATPSTAAPAPAREPDGTAPGEPQIERPTSGGVAGGDVLPDRATEDTDAAWGEREGDGNDERLHRDRPPHWE